ncbi:LPS-assembly protein LptD [Tropicimonas sediminicola]|uniref:LPS-assembly protein LptD n=1 Tax=Tropicimonas sediminicola TaxID=1031541 RepID=A0A239EJA9_9RHOB|nr:LPS assembly protein LptD [Tropicimonas sediminicola]SNS44358.1 LPS-assembly protein [Tropicimonas sediminicola]
MRLRTALLALMLSTALPAVAQEDSPVSTLIADRVEITADGKLVASGNVEAFYEGARLRAGRITYDEDADLLEIEGPIVLTQGENTIVLADSAALSPDLRNGLLRSARVVMDQQLQLAAAEIDRVDGRYTQLYRTVASSCEVCAANPVPLWQIRARRVVHDDLEKQLYFDDAVFEVVGVPVMYLPQLRLPDPSVERASGFLTPSLRTTDELGLGVKIPYFFRIGDDKDLTVTPYVSANRTRTLELRYRQAFRSGDIEMNGAVSRDDIRPEGPRAYLFAEGGFSLPNDYKLEFDIETVSDDTYLLDYDYSDKDRLDSALNLSRVGRDRLFETEAVVYRSLRSSEDNETQPFLVGDATWTRRYDVPVIGGTGSFQLEAHGHQRRSSEDVEGRDVGRVAGLLDWTRAWSGPVGMLFTADARLTFDHTIVDDDSNYPDTINQTTPYGAVEMRWPWVRQDAGSSQVIEPVVQLVWSPDDGENTPQDESTQLEFDEGNLFSFSRFPADDVQERGLRANVGISWTRYDEAGWTLGATVGRIYRQDDLGQFSGYETFDGIESDLLTAVRLELPNRMTLVNRALLGDDYDVTKNELRLSWDSDMLEFASTYVWMQPSEVEDRDDITHEWRIDGDWQINDRWSSSADVRYDLELDRSASARVGVVYSTECATFDLSVRRRFTSTDQLNPSTDYTFEVQLAGFGNTGEGRSSASRSACRG